MPKWSHIWNRMWGREQTTYPDSILAVKTSDAHRYAFVDLEVGTDDHRIHDIGALRHDKAVFHEANKRELMLFIDNVDFLCGHNIIHHDAKYLFDEGECRWLLTDTLYVSPLLFPERPYHRLLKDDKLVCEQLNNPVNDCKKAKELLDDELHKWDALTEEMKTIFAVLLGGHREFIGFLSMVNAADLPGVGRMAGTKGKWEVDKDALAQLIMATFEGRICRHTDLATWIGNDPCALAYALALINTADHHSITPAWVTYQYPNVEHIIHLLRHKRCEEGCDYCNRQLSAHHNLKRFFGYDQFRTYDNEPLQERAVCAAIDGKSLLAIFPTGGGKSLTFQLPAIMAGRAEHGLTVVISPLQSLMKDQVDNLEQRGITDAVTINGMLNPIERSLAIERVVSGDASLLYISPESLRSYTTERMLLARHVVRFVIDEAHCFSAWGQDFRVDYQYIGRFILDYQKKKKLQAPIPVSCFTATAKPKVVQDICDHFERWLGAKLQIFASTATRTNLHYSVVHAENDTDKYNKLRSLISEASCPTIVYVSRTKRAKHLARCLTRDGLKALPFHGKMQADNKKQNQEAFMAGDVDIIVATTAFGMGVDKSDVGLVVHYDISDSLENYVQEAGRAGRDPSLQARCYVLYCDNDLDKHFILLNQTKLSISEIQQVWRAIKDLTVKRDHCCCSPLEIARKAGWHDDVSDIETRVKAALSVLEEHGYIERGNNIPHVYATGITVNNVEEARLRISSSSLFAKDEAENAIRIIKSLITKKHNHKNRSEEAESRIDYLADILGMNKRDVVSAVERMRQEGILDDVKDITAYMRGTGDKSPLPEHTLKHFTLLEKHLLAQLSDEPLLVTYKQLNEELLHNDAIKKCNEKDLRTLMFFLTVKHYVQKTDLGDGTIRIVASQANDALQKRFLRRKAICDFALTKMKELAAQSPDNEKNKVVFSVVALHHDIQTARHDLFDDLSDVTMEEVEEALLYMQKTNVLDMEGGFLVLYNTMKIQRKKERKYSFVKDDYRLLQEFYRQRMQQIHIVGKYANLMVSNYDAALRYVSDYFQMDYRKFIDKYFKGEAKEQLDYNITSSKYKQLFDNLSKRQMEIISDKESHCLVVAAGPGSGKTRILVHKLASLLLLEDVKHEQMLMLTFSRAAATEFKQRLMALIGNAAHFVDIKTFHSYSFDILGRIGNLESSGNVVAEAAKMIVEGQVESNKIRKTVLVIDEAQDMDADAASLVCALMQENKDMRVIAVGDDDQNIYAFRGSNSKYMQELACKEGARRIEMTDNYRSDQRIVAVANAFVQKIGGRLKQTPIASMSPQQGHVCIIHYAVGLLYEPLVSHLVSHRKKGSTCVLTQNNQEATFIVNLLQRRGINAKLIQSLDGFRFYNLAEVRYFLKQLHTEQRNPIIPNECWQRAKEKTFARYSGSMSLPYLKVCIKQFEELHRDKKYQTDLFEFLYESSVEDFCDTTGADVIVSTIHRAKGREFDHVIMLAAGINHVSDELYRCLYVGMTRAKQSLTIHTDSTLFDHIPEADHQYNMQYYDWPREIMIQLTHKDINLSSCKDHKSEILSLLSGQTLRYLDHELCDNVSCKPLAKLSISMQDTLGKWRALHYAVTSARVRFIVAWKSPKALRTEEPIAIVLPDLTLQRTDNNI